MYYCQEAFEINKLDAFYGVNSTFFLMAKQFLTKAISCNINFIINWIFHSASLDRNPLSKFVSDYGQDSFKDSELCGATEEFQDMQQTGQTSDFYDYTQQSSNDAEFQV